jgi:hypothetical protein
VPLAGSLGNELAKRECFNYTLLRLVGHRTCFIRLRSRSSLLNDDRDRLGIQQKLYVLEFHTRSGTLALAFQQRPGTFLDCTTIGSPDYARRWGSPCGLCRIDRRTDTACEYNSPLHLPSHGLSDEYIYQWSARRLRFGFPSSLLLFPLDLLYHPALHKRTLRAPVSRAFPVRETPSTGNHSYFNISCPACPFSSSHVRYPGTMPGSYCAAWRRGHGTLPIEYSHDSPEV